jgi:hypothetical protein
VGLRRRIPAARATAGAPRPWAWPIGDIAPKRANRLESGETPHDAQPRRPAWAVDGTGCARTEAASSERAA